MNNRDLGTITKLETGQITVLMEGKTSRILKFNPEKMRHFDHGYAVTLHVSQGLTEGRVSANIDTGSSRFHVNGPSIDSLMLAPNDDIRPTTFQPIVRADEEGAPFIELAPWGFVPFWQKEDKFPPTTFNARAEGIEKAPMWRHSLEAKRCLIPADSFFEWKHIAKKGNPKYEFSVGGGIPFAFAGLWSSWTNPADNTELHSFTIITTDPNSLLEQYHNRMPVILKPSEYARWLSGDRVPIDLLRPFNPDAMTATCVDPGTAVTAKEATLFDSL